MNHAHSNERTCFTKDQVNLLEDFVRQTTRSEAHIDFCIMGFADRADVATATAFLGSMQGEDWKTVSAHQAFAGIDDLLVGVLLRVRADSSDSNIFWVVMTAPFEIMQPPKLIAWGRVERAPDVAWKSLLEGVKE